MTRTTRRILLPLMLAASLATLSDAGARRKLRSRRRRQTSRPSQCAGPAGSCVARVAAGSAPAQAAEEKPAVAITISKETTGITEPLRKNGYVDYLLVLNQRFAQGVTPQNNASALLWTAVGPDEVRPEDRQQYFGLLGIPPPAEKGDYLAGLDKYLTRSQDKTRGKYGSIKGKTKGDTSALLHAAMTRPWSKQEFAELAALLAAREKSLALVVEASKRPERYDPLFTEKEGILSVILLPALLQYHDAAEALLARAMLRIGEGKPAAAWDDLLTCHRLARLIGQGLTLAEILYAVDLDGLACAGDQVLRQSAKLSPAEVAKFRADLQGLPPLPKLVDCVNVAERFLFLDGIALVAREGISAADKLTEGQEDSRGGNSSFINSLAGAVINWDHVLRTGNKWYDEITAGYAKPTRPERKKAMSQVEEDIGKQANAAGGWASTIMKAISDPKQLYTAEFAKVFLTKVLPTLRRIANVADRGTMQFELDKLAFALAAYRADHGSYPAKLADLKPKYVAQIPKDIFNDAELHYRQEGNGYLLYSVGVNEKDDGGKTRADRKADEEWDDLARSHDGAEVADPVSPLPHSGRGVGGEGSLRHVPADHQLSGATGFCGGSSKMTRGAARHSTLTLSRSVASKLSRTSAFLMSACSISMSTVEFPNNSASRCRR